MNRAEAFSEDQILPRGKLLMRYKNEYIGNSKKLESRCIWDVWF